MKNLVQLVIGGLAIVGIGTAGYRAYKVKKLADIQKEEMRKAPDIFESRDSQSV